MRRNSPSGESTITIIATLVAVVLSAISIVLSLVLWHADKEEKRREAEPRLVFVRGSERIGSKQTVITLQNLSPVTPAAITGMEFVIEDADLLAQIHRKHPQPDGAVTMAHNESNDGVFREGEWGYGGYSFSMSCNLHLRPSTVEDMRLTIVNRKWAKQKFTGTLYIYYNGENSPLTLTNVIVSGHSQK